MRQTPHEGAFVTGHFALGNTTVSIEACGAHHDLIIIPNPEAFKSERWLNGKGKDLQSYSIAFLPERKVIRVGTYRIQSRACCRLWLRSFYCLIGYSGPSQLVVW